MAHIHLEDGSFTVFWAIAWWLVAIAVISLSIIWLRKIKKVDGRIITVAGLCTAAAFAIFQISIPIAGGVHLNLTPLIGILTGPAVGSLIVLIVNIFSAAIGHGGWGLIGANCLINITELTSAYFIYKGMERLTKSVFARAGVATLLGLFIGNVAMIAIILASGIQGVNQSKADILWGLSLIAGINMMVAVIEAAVTGYVISYISKVRPDMLKEALYA
ncbi:Putative ABC-type Co2+ transport system, permease component [Methanocella conradii HZ254]|uniref:ABC-type Co2+ transport system, permease component n=1 Tax=Methanocella conradii (strain DSM 24694 / JCM 17849 / CGMCC 1.5162 / HZ254) TaxID=1041930 RepID=H8I6B2_METCZ|nr:energy-coupling factor ABC transporter permease [Methanocella conradii]AFD00759.1 Putative ABC-type Co2+ transport system, permease component [Methanocella conradii HZ254]MDI6897962.1 energy-coupling factor ABC transporter permease [Methanocella conradii]